jgi:hypothetical protein
VKKNNRPAYIIIKMEEIWPLDFSDARRNKWKSYTRWNWACEISGLRTGDLERLEFGKAVNQSNALRFAS